MSFCHRMDAKNTMKKIILILLIPSLISLAAVGKEPQPKEEISKPIPGSNMNMNAE